MNIKHILPTLLAGALALAGCSDGENFNTLDSISVSTSYVSIDSDGGSATVNISAAYSWTIDAADTDSWLEFDKLSGSAGSTTLTLSAEASVDGRETSFNIDLDNGDTQIINVIQGVSGITTATCAEVIAGPDAKTFQVTGTVTAIANTTYGNFYLADDTGSIYIYGLMVDGSYPNGTMPFSVGDEVTVSGPKTTYGTTVELVDAELISVNKSLISVESVDVDELPLEGGTVTYTLSCSGDGVTVAIPEDAQDWLSIKSITSTSGSAVIVFQAEANTGGDRSTTITFYTTDGEKDYTCEATLTQAGSILEVSIAEFNAAEDGDTKYRLTGMISSIYNADRGRFYICDYSDTTYVYNMSDFASLGVKQYDIVTLVGNKGSYGTTMELLNATLESYKSVTEISIADVLNVADDSETYYLVTGTVESIANTTYGNLYLTDGNGSTIYVYGLYPGYGATGDYRKGVIEAKGIEAGDTLTLVAYKTSYGSTLELCGGWYISHTSAASE